MPRKTSMVSCYILIHIEHCNSGWILIKSKQHHQKFVLAWYILGIGSLHIPTISWELQWFTQKDHMEILGKCLDKKTHWTILDIPAKHNLDTALSTIGLVNDEMISMENKISSPIINKIELYRCCVLLTLSAVSPVTVTVQNWSSANFVLPSPGTVNPRPKRTENRLHRSESPMPRPILFPSASLFFPAPKKTKNIKVRCSIYPSSMLPSCKKKQTTLHPSKISISFQKITSDAFGLAFGILSIFATFTLFGVSRTRILWESVVETHLTPLIPNQIQ